MRNTASSPRRRARPAPPSNDPPRNGGKRRKHRVTLDELSIVTDPVQAAEVAGLVHVDDQSPGITRRRAGRGFVYLGPDGRPIAAAKRARIESLRIPPAWTEVWICPLENGHIQATGRDDRGRKQYRYHERWREVRDETKYHRMIAFGHALPIIREVVDRALDLPGLPRDKVLATVVRLLDWTHIRVGNDEYTRDNESFGLTTMQDRHVAIDGDLLHFRFRGKHGKDRRVHVRDARLAKVVRRCADLPGHELFRYVDGDGGLARLRSEDVNEYLRTISGEDFTAKDFRTWAGTVLVARELVALGAAPNQTQMKHRLIEAIDRVAQHLGNTRTVCRKCYTHPTVIEAYADQSLFAAFRAVVAPPARLAAEEARVLVLLEARLAQTAPLAAAA